jgi:DNA invertase Pin-like site-specific DNA recombinase
MKTYSYIRWSSDKQTKGDSLRRQTKLATEYCLKHNLTLEDVSFTDIGISAYKGDNIAVGALGAFLTAIDEKRIETPCILLVEALDRITRTEVDVALELFLSIVRRGVTLITLQNEQVFSSETIKKDRGISLIIVISHLIQGHEDSAKRGDRVKEAWDKKRIKQTKGVIATAKGPSWCVLSDDRSHWTVDKTKADTVKRIYELALAGNGSLKITIILNSEKVPCVGYKAKTWSAGNVGGLLRQEAVFGRFKQVTGELVIDDYYPVIVSKADFDAVQAGIRGRGGKGGHLQGVSNLFSGMSYCAYCGGRMKFTMSGIGHLRRPYLACLTRQVGRDCDATFMPYLPLEKAILDRLINKQARDLTPWRMIETSEKNIATIEQQLVIKHDEMERLMKVIMKVPDLDIAIEQLKATKNELARLETELQKARITPITEQELEQSTELFRLLTTTNDAELRLKVQTALRRQVKKIEVAAKVHLREDKKAWAAQYRDPTGRYQWNEDPTHVAIIHYAGGSERGVDITPFL